MSDPVLKGRDKAKQNTFNRLLSRPEEYLEPQLAQVSIIRRRVSHCQLCGQAIGYDFLLEHGTHEKKNLYIGSDCLKSFCETYMPNLAASLLRNLELAMERAVEREKAQAFLQNHPEFLTQIQDLRKSIVDLLLKYNLWQEFGRSKPLPIFDTIDTATRDLRKSGYTTKPKVEKIEDMIQLVRSEKLETRLKNHLKQREKKLTIQDDVNRSPKNEEFYVTFFKYVKYMSWDRSRDYSLSSPMLSKIDKDIFIIKLEDYLGRKQRNKTKFKKELPVVLEQMKVVLLDSLQVKELNEESYRWNMHDVSKEYKYAIPFLSNISLIQRFSSEYGLVRMSNFLRNKLNDKMESFQSEYDFKLFSNSFVFKNEDMAREFSQKLFKLYEVEIEQVAQYAKSDVLVSDDFH